MLVVHTGQVTNADLEEMVMYCHDNEIDLRAMTVHSTVEGELSADFEFSNPEDASAFKIIWG